MALARKLPKACNSGFPTRPISAYSMTYAAFTLTRRDRGLAGQTVRGYETLWTTIQTLLLGMMGDFDAEFEAKKYDDWWDGWKAPAELDYWRRNIPREQWGKGPPLAGTSKDRREFDSGNSGWLRK